MKLLQNGGIAMLVLLGITTYFAGYMIYDGLQRNDTQNNISYIIIGITLFLAWIQFFTRGTDSKIQKDELGKQIKYKSSKISYEILTLVLLILYLVDLNYYQSEEGFGNVFLLIGLGISVLLNPIIQFIMSLRYR